MPGGRGWVGGVPSPNPPPGAHSDARHSHEGGPCLCVRQRVDFNQIARPLPPTSQHRSLKARVYVSEGHPMSLYLYPW